MVIENRLMLPLIGLLVLLTIAMAWYQSTAGKGATPDTVSPVETSHTLSSPNASGNSDEASSSTQISSNNEESGSSPHDHGDKASVQELQTLLDDDSTRQEALVKALGMVNGSIREQEAAIDAFRWLGGRKAMRALIQLNHHATATVADEAGNVLNHLLSQGLYTDGIRRDEIPDDGIVILDEGLYDDELNDENQRPDEALWLEAIQLAADNNTRDGLFIILSAYPLDQSMPVLLKLLDSPDTAIRNSALEHVHAIAGNDDIFTRQQGEEWLAKAIANASEPKDQATADDAQ